MPDSLLFAQRMSLNGGTTYFSITTGHVSVARFDNPRYGAWEFQAKNGVIRNRAEVELEELMQQETLTLQCDEVLAAFSSERVYEVAA